MALLHNRILLLGFIIGWPISNSLKCYFNYCADGLCKYEGNGIQEDCWHWADPKIHTNYCFDFPIGADSEQLERADCASTNHTTAKVPGCGPEYEHLTGSPLGCICFEDFCNNHFKNNVEFVNAVDENGKAVPGDRRKT